MTRNFWFWAPAVLLLIFACSGPEARPIHAVTFDGASCAVDGPVTVPAGDRSFVVTNLSEWESIPLYVVRLTDEHSFQDLADLQAERGGAPAYFSTPGWGMIRQIVLAKQIPAVRKFLVVRRLYAVHQL